MRAPSTDLLRALCLATLPHSSSSAICLAARQIPQSYPSLSHHRTIKTSSHLYGMSKVSGRPVSSPQRTAPNTNPPATTTTKTTSGTTSRGVIPPSPRSSPINPRAPRNHDRGPVSEEDTQTDFAKMDILTNAGATTPATAIDACVHDGFHLNNGVQTRDGLGVLLIDGEAFVWAPWNATVTSDGTNNPTQKDTNTNTTQEPTATATTTTPKGPNASGRSSSSPFNRFLDRRGILTLPPASLGVFELIYPKPDLLIIGTGRKLWMLGRETREYLSEQLGIRVDIMDTANAAAAYNLLATERGVTEVAALMIPDGFLGL